ncbi:hypothetical protein [Faecalibacterium prausnitzii]|uniref:hypothetical protein n=1 Tax=Faecalibacterium prausnitzii TaxID=853 RepID=UPI003DA0E607
MKYVKQHFVTGMKVSLPDVLNRMEDGIAAACGAAVEGIGSVTTGDTPAAGIRDGKLCLTLPRGDPGPQGAPGEKGDPGTGLTDRAKTLLRSLLAGTALDRDASLAALRAEWGVADRSTDTETAAAAPGAAGADTEAASAERGA